MLFYKSIMAAIMIAIGCIANLVAMPSPLGAFLFPVGLLVVCGEGYKLATGMAKNLASGDWEEFLCVFCINVLFINFCGLFGQFFGVEEAARIVVESISKLNWVEVLVRAMACGFLMTEAVAGWRRGSWITTYMCVAVFVFCGFRHCIADAFYITVAGHWPAALGSWMIIVAGNIIGGLTPIVWDKY